MANESDGQHRKFLGMAVGVVVDNEDPEKVGRVRVRVPGIFEPASPWALPLGWPGAGAKQRGGFYPVPKGAEVAVFCNMGDQDHPYYISANPGRGEQPEEVQDSATTPADANKVHAWEGERYRVVYDERDGKQQVQIKDKKYGDKIELDGVGLGITISATTGIHITTQGSLSLEGLAVSINGRTVANNGKPIT